MIIGRWGVRGSVRTIPPYKALEVFIRIQRD